MSTDMTRREFLRYALVGSAAVALAACAPKAEPTKAPVAVAPTKAAEKATEPAKAEPIEMTLWSMWTEGEPQQVANTQIMDNYNKATGNTVTPNWIGRKNLTNVAAALAAGTQPDMISSSGSGLVVGPIKEGILVDLTEAMAQNGYGSDKPWKDTFLSGTLEAAMVDDKYYFGPQQLAAFGFWHNKTYFQKLGITEFPETWDAFMEVADKIKADGVAPFLVKGSGGYTRGQFDFMLHRYFGDGWVGEACLDKTGDKWTDPGVVEMAKLWEMLRDNGYFPEDWVGLQFPTYQVDWATGLAGMFWVASWIISETKEYVDDDWQYDVFSHPAVPGGKAGNDVTELWVGGASVLKDSKQISEAVEFVRFFTSLESAKLFVEVAKAPVSTVGGGAPEEAKGVVTMMENVITHTRLSVDGAGQVEPEYVTKVWNAQVELMQTGELTAEDFAVEMKTASEAYWKSKA